MIRLDTHVVLWLYSGEIDRFGSEVLHLLEENDLLVSPMVELELTYLYEIGRFSVDGADTLKDLEQRVGLRLSDVPFATVARRAAAETWTRDPFDRIIVADALAADTSLITADRVIREHCTLATW